MKLTTKELRMIIKEEFEAVMLDEGFFDMFRRDPQIPKKILDKPAESWSLEAERDWDPHKYIMDKDVENKINFLESAWEAHGPGGTIDIVAMLKEKIGEETRSIVLEDGNLEIHRGQLTWEWEEEIQTDRGWTHKTLQTTFNEKTFQWSRIDINHENSWDRDY